MRKLLIALTLLAGACAPVYAPRPFRARVYAPRRVYVRPAAVVVVPRRIWW